jgi:hypothetical protein
VLLHGIPRQIHCYTERHPIRSRELEVGRLWHTVRASPTCVNSFSAKSTPSWTGVVVHNVPGDQLLSDVAEGKQYEEVGDSLGAERSQVKDVRVLCRQEEYNARATFSVRLMLTDEPLAQQAIRHGVFLYGTHCRVSRYRRRSKLAGVPSVGVHS